MWKHKNFINLQLCAPPPITTTLNIYVNGITTSITVGSESSSAGTWTGEQEFNTSSYTINGNTVVWSDGTILQYNGVDVLPTDTIVENRQYTTRAATPTLTFKHFYDAGTIGSGTVKFRHYSQTEPLPQLATPQNVTADGTTVSWDAVKNATSYKILADGTSIGTAVNVSYNLTNSTGWAALSDGNHNITIVAKADGYRDSERSSAVVVTKSTTPTEDELAGTWVFNEILNLSAESLPGEVIAESGWIGLPITTDGGDEYAGLLFGPLNEEINEFPSLLYGETEVYNGVWGKESDRTITIDALLEDVKNGQALLEFLQNNGTKQGSATLI